MYLRTVIRFLPFVFASHIVIAEQFFILALVLMVNAGRYHAIGRGFGKNRFDVLAVAADCAVPQSALLMIRLCLGERAKRLHKQMLARLVAEMHDITVLLLTIEKAGKSDSCFSRFLAGD